MDNYGNQEKSSRYHWSPSGESTSSSLSIGSSLSEHYDSDVDDEIQEETWFTVPDHMVGYAIGKEGRMKNKIMQQTNTYIKTKRDEDDTTFFIIRGSRKNRYSAKLFIKQIVNTGLLRNRGLDSLRFPVIDSSGGDFKLQVVEKGDHVFQSKKKMFKPVLRSSSKDVTNNGSADYGFLSDQIKRILLQNKENNRSSKIWCHFGRICLTKIDKDEETKIYTLEELNSHLIPRQVSPPETADVSKWHLRFFGGIQVPDEELFFRKLEKGMYPRYERCPPFLRYEFTYLTPCCREIRIKVFIEVRPHASDLSKAVFENAPSPVEVKNVLKFSDSYPFFYMCESTAKRAMVDIFEPSGMDIRLIAEANLTSSPEEGELREEVDILYDFVRENLNITQDGIVDLPQDNVPDDFDLHYSRMSERKMYSVTSDEGEQFDVILCYESPRDIKKGEYDETHNVIDIHLYYHEWEDKLKSSTWEPEQIVNKIPQFMACARSLARTLMVDDTTPPEILARGPKALRAYQRALKSGKTKNLRVPVILIGQSRAGKTSLLRSLKCEKFDPGEDSTEGVRLHRSISKAAEDVWKEGETTENSFCDSAARVIAENLTTESTNAHEFSAQEDGEDTVYQEFTNQESGSKDDAVAESDNVKEAVKEQSKGRPLQSETTGLPIHKKEDSGRHMEVPPDYFNENQIPEEVSAKTSHILKNISDMENSDSIHLITMDFAGQPVYQATHPVFLCQRGIYVLVHSLENDVHGLATPIVKRGSLSRKVNDNCPMTNMDHLEFWLSFVASNAIAQQVESDKSSLELQFQELNLPEKSPPVFLVCTHADVPSGKQNPEEMSQEILAHLKREENPPGGHLVHAVYPVDNTVSGSSERENDFVNKLRKDIRAAAKTLPQTNEYIPIRWLKFEEELSKLVEKDQKNFLSHEEAKIVARQCQVDLKSDEFYTLLNYLHDLKIIIYFEDTKMVIINTQWLLDMLVKVITVQPFLEWKKGFESYWKKLENDGILDRVLVEHVWSDLTDGQNTIDNLLRIMEKFTLLCRWQTSDESEVFLVPAMLVNNDAKRVDNLMTTDPKLSPPLVIKFTSSHLPLGIFPRLLVAITEMCNKEWAKSRPPEFFQNYCRFYNVDGKKGAFDLVVTSDMRTITIGVITVKDINHNPDLLSDFCQGIIVFLKNNLNDMRSNFPWMKYMEFEFGIRCPICTKSSEPCNFHSASGCMRDACAHFVPERELPRCYNDPTSTNTVIQEEAYSHWFSDNTEDDLADLCDAFKALAVKRDVSVSEGDENYEKLITIFGAEASIKTVDAHRFAEKLANYLKLDKSSLQNPPEEIQKNCRIICKCIKKLGRMDIIRELHKTLPSGMTGPLRKDDVLVTDILGNLEDLTRSLCGNDTWKKMADNLGIRGCHFDYYKAKDNPAESILEDACRKRRLTVGDLYDILLKCEVNALADQYL